MENEKDRYETKELLAKEGKRLRAATTRSQLEDSQVGGFHVTLSQQNNAPLCS